MESGHPLFGPGLEPYLACLVKEVKSSPALSPLAPPAQGKKPHDLKRQTAVQEKQSLQLHASAGHDPFVLPPRDCVMLSLPLARTGMQE